MTSRQQQEPELYEVLTQRAGGHQTVLRVLATSAADAKRRARERYGVSSDRVVEVSVARAEGSQEAAAASPDSEEPAAAGEPYDPGEHTVPQVNAHLDSVGEQERESILQAERQGRARKGIVG